VFLKVDGAWLTSTKLKKLKRRGVDDPLCMVLRAWKFVLDECKDDAPVMGETELEELEDALDWDGDDGALIEAFRAVGFLDGNRFDLWWEDGAEPLNAARRYEREKKRNQRKAKSPGKTKESRGKSKKSRRKDGDNGDVPTENMGTSPQSRVEKSREEKSLTRDAREGTADAVGPTGPETPKPDSWVQVRNAWVEEWDLREGESKRNLHLADRGFFGKRGPFRMHEKLDALRERGPAEVIEKAIASFWEWWDSEEGGKKRMGPKAWRPSPMNLDDLLEEYLVERGMTDKLTWLLASTKLDHEAAKKSVAWGEKMKARRWDAMLDEISEGRA
jgi:hypothetical protein